MVPGFYKSREWQELRYKTLRKHNFTCLACNRTNCEGAILHVDHIKPTSKYPELALDENNLQILCEDCNMGKSNFYEDDLRSNKPKSRGIKPLLVDAPKKVLLRLVRVFVDVQKKSISLGIEISDHTTRGGR